MTVAIISKSLVLSPVVVAKVVTMGKYGSEAEVVVRADEAGVTGGAASQPSLTLTPVLISPRPTILMSSIGTLRHQRSRRRGRIITYLSTQAVTR